MSTQPDVLIPRAFGSVAKIAIGKDDTHDHLRAVHVMPTLDRGLIVEATDGHRLLRVVIPDPPSVANYPAVLPDDDGAIAPQALIPMANWEQAFKQCPKAPRWGNGIIGNVAARLRSDVTLATTDLEAPTVTTVRQPEGTFPNLDTVIPADKPTSTVWFDAKLMSGLLTVMASMAPDRQPMVRLDLYGESKPMKITRNVDGAELTGVLAQGQVK